MASSAGGAAGLPGTSLPGPSQPRGTCALGGQYAFTLVAKSKHRIALTGSIVLLVTAGALASANAAGAETVTIREGSSKGSAVPVGTTLSGKSSNFVIHMTAGNVECASSTMEGPLESNGKTENEMNAKVVTAKERTTTFLGKPTATVTTNAPWPVQIQWWSFFNSAWWRPFWLTSSLTYTVNLSSGQKCVYGFKEMKALSPTGPPLVVEFTKQPVTKESGAAPCEEKAEMSGKYTMKTAKGELAITTP